MARCTLENVGQRGELFVHRCRNCGRECTARNADPALVKQMCSASATKRTGPSLAKRAVNLGRSIVRGIAEGAFRVPETIVAERLAVCRACPLFDAAKETCSHPECGCRVRAGGLLNKLVWSHERCPIGRWSAQLRQEINSQIDR